MAVVVQQMVFPQAAGILFTADPSPATGRSPPSTPASASAKPWSPASSNADVYKVRGDEVVAKGNRRETACDRGFAGRRNAGNMQSIRGARSRRR